MQVCMKLNSKFDRMLKKVPSFVLNFGTGRLTVSLACDIVIGLGTWLYCAYGYEDMWEM